MANETKFYVVLMFAPELHYRYVLTSCMSAIDLKSKIKAKVKGKNHVQLSYIRTTECAFDCSFNPEKEVNND